MSKPWMNMYKAGIPYNSYFHTPLPTTSITAPKIKKWIPPHQDCSSNNKHRRTHTFFFIVNPLQMASNSIVNINHIKITTLHTMVNYPPKRRQDVIGQITIKPTPFYYYFYLYYFFSSVLKVPSLLTRTATKLSIQGQGVHCVRAFIDNDQQ